MRYAAQGHILTERCQEFKNRNRVEYYKSRPDPIFDISRNSVTLAHYKTEFETRQIEGETQTHTPQ